MYTSNKITEFIILIPIACLKTRSIFNRYRDRQQISSSVSVTSNSKYIQLFSERYFYIFTVIYTIDSYNYMLEKINFIEKNK